MRRKCKQILFLAIALLGVGIAAGQDVVTVNATGYGRHPADAEKDAIRAAVEKVVGQFVDSETMVKNEEVIRDQVLTYSDGIVKRILSKSEPEKDGALYKVSLVAEVLPGKVTQRLEEAKIIVAKVQGEDLWAQAVSQIKNSEDGVRILRKFFDDYPVNSLLVAELIDDSGRRGKEAVPTQKVDPKDPRKMAIAINIAIRFDLDQYYNKYVPKLNKLLDVIGKNVDSSVTRNTPETDYWKCGITGVPGRMLKSEPWRNENRLSGDDKVDWLVGVNIGRDRLGTNQRFSIYGVDKEIYKEIFLQQIHGLGDVNVAYCGNDGQILVSDKVSIGSGYQKFPEIIKSSDDYSIRSKVPLKHSQKVTLSADKCFWRKTDRNPEGSYVSPEFFADGHLCDEVILRYETEIAVDDVKGMKEITLRIEAGDASGKTDKARRSMSQKARRN